MMGIALIYETIAKKIIQRIQYSVPDFLSVKYVWLLPWQPIKVSKDDIDYHRVNFGIKKTGQLNPPECFVIPRDDNIEIAATSTQYHNISFEIVAIVENVSQEGGLYESIELAGKIYDCLLADRTILGSCQDLHIPRFSPQCIEGDDKTFLHQTNIFLDCKFLTTAG